MEIGYNFLGGSFFYGESGSFYAISYEYNWDKNTSFIIKPSFSQNRDFFIGTSDDGVSEFRTELNIIRFSLCLERKFGNPERKFFGSYRFGVGNGFIINGNYEETLTYSNNLQPSNVASKNSINKANLNLITMEIFTEFGLGVGYRINSS